MLSNALTPSDDPLYNIGVVSRMTDIPIPTLRVWERRYAFPESTRTAGRHRLYSERQVLRLRWVKARIDEGMQTGHAIRALQHMEEENRLPDSVLVASTRQPGQARRITGPQPPASDTSMTAFHQRLTDALLNHETDQAGQFLADTLALYPLEAILADVIQPTLVSIGEAWHNGQINVATEHLASNFLRNRLLAWLTSGPPPHPVPPVVLACAPEEWHEITLLITGVLLRRRRWPVAYLGQAVPLPDLASFVKETQPSAIVAVAMTEESAASLVDWPQHLPNAYKTGSPFFGYAGAIFTFQPEWRERIAGAYLGDTIEAGIDTLEIVLNNVWTALGGN